jgi:succinate dehydrogenase/fumarate reductase flavoprotein subunit
LYVEMENLLVLGKALATATLARAESRGGFYREDHPEASADIPEAHVIALSEAGEVLLRKEVLDPEWNSRSPDLLDKERWG